MDLSDVKVSDVLKYPECLNTPILNELKHAGYELCDFPSHATVESQVDWDDRYTDSNNINVCARAFEILSNNLIEKLKTKQCVELCGISVNSFSELGKDGLHCTVSYRKKTNNAEL